MKVTKKKATLDLISDKFLLLGITSEPDGSVTVSDMVKNLTTSDLLFLKWYFDKRVNEMVGRKLQSNNK